MAVPGCAALGRQCRELPLLLRISRLDEDAPAEQDALGTWLLGHTGRMTFGTPYVQGQEVLVEAVVHVPCRFLTEDGGGSGRRPGRSPDVTPSVRCAAHGYRGPLPLLDPAVPPRYRHGGDRFTVVQDGKRREVTLPPRPAPPHALPVLESRNPCATAACRTADNTRGAACCRDLTLDVVAPEGAGGDLEDLLRSRKIPYLCKVTRASRRIIECEVISACGYLDRDGVSCSLHDRIRPDGNPAKPMVCTAWPDPDGDKDFTGHPGCVFLGTEAQHPAG